MHYILWIFFWYRMFFLVPKLVSVDFRNLQGDRNTIHKNLVASLFVAEVVFLFGIIQYDQPVSGTY